MMLARLALAANVRTPPVVSIDANGRGCVETGALRFGKHLDVPGGSSSRKIAHGGSDGVLVPCFPAVIGVLLMLRAEWDRFSRCDPFQKRL